MSKCDIHDGQHKNKYGHIYKKEKSAITMSLGRVREIEREIEREKERERELACNKRRRRGKQVCKMQSCRQNKR